MAGDSSSHPELTPQGPLDMEATCRLRVAPGELLGTMEQTWAQLCLQPGGHPEAWGYSLGLLVPLSRETAALWFSLGGRMSPLVWGWVGDIGE